MKRFTFQILLLTFFVRLANLQASSVLPMSFDEQFKSARGVFRGTVLAGESFQDTNGLIWTRTFIRVDESFSGKFPAVIRLAHRGGEVNGIGMRDDSSPRFRAGEECVLWISRRADGTLFVNDGDVGAVKLSRKSGVLAAGPEALLKKIRDRQAIGNLSTNDFSDQGTNGFVVSPVGDTGGSSTNGLTADSYGAPGRYPTSDRGEAIPYLVDAQFLPTGITLAQALGAVSNAFAAWASAGSCKFVFAGTNNFGQAAANINTNDGVFRIQLHDAYHFIPEATVLGKGGSYFTTNFLVNANWRPGGNVAGMEFDQNQCGFVVLKHTNVVMQTLSTFTEVLTHEIGHVLGLAHSSEITTNNPVLTNSIMYYLAHADGRGAALNSYDTNVIREGYPLNTPPYSYPRVLDITTAGTQTNFPGINQIELRGYSLQYTNLTLMVTNLTTINGTFTNPAGIIIKYNCPNFSDSSRIDPASLSYYDDLYARFSDGTNASPYVTVRVVSFNHDSTSPSDGIPDAWMTSNFGHTAPLTSDKSTATNDADGDKLNNLQEYIAGMVPTNSASAQRITFISTNQLQWQAKAYELYEVQFVTNLLATNWTRFGNPVLPVTSTGAMANIYSPTNSPRFFRIQKVP